MQQYDPKTHNRRSIRLWGYDYSDAGAYFITLCAHNRKSLFGNCRGGFETRPNPEIRLNKHGNIVRTCWHDLPRHYTRVELDAFVIMPNHVHGIIVLADSADVDVGAGFKPARTPAPEPAPTKHGLSEIVRAFKTFSARRINKMRRAPGTPVWQRNYYERIIRNDDEMARIREYITNNPILWHLDRENTDRTGENEIYRWLWGVEGAGVRAGLKPAPTKTK